MPREGGPSKFSYMEKGKILIVDDEADICEILQFNLENAGFNVDCASSAEEALKKLSSEHSLILLDVMMDGMSGFRMAEVVRKERGSQIPIIFLTAKNAENDLLTGFSAGGDDYIGKPFSIHEVIARVKAVLKRAGGPSSAEQAENDIVFCGFCTERAATTVIIFEKRVWNAMFREKT